MSIQQMLLGASGASGYLMDKSLRFRASASANLSRTAGTATNTMKWTWSGWVKRGSFGTTQVLMNGYQDDSNLGNINFVDESLQMARIVGGTVLVLRKTNAVFRDPSAWYHIVCVFDNANATVADRVQIYVNSVLQTYSTSNDPGTTGFFINAATRVQRIGRSGSTASPFYFDGYLADVNFIDGQALTPASFGSTNALTGVWQPKAYTGTYGTNGFYLDFEDTSSVAALGTDSSGNGNNWTVNNVSLTSGVTYDSMTDVPTLTSETAANYAVLNPLNFGTACSPTPMTVAGGNLNWSYNRSSSGSTWMPGTIQVPPNSKIYFEFVQTSASSAVGASFGICYTDLRRDSSNPTIWRTINAFNGNKFSDTVNTAYGTSFAVNDICGVAVDLVNGKIFFSKNGTWQGSADPVAGTNAAFTDLVSSGYSWLPVVYGSGGDSNAGSANFGQRPFAFSPPTGFKALNTFNLPTATILKGNTVMDATTYTGNGSTQTITNAASFQPDLVWMKDRSAAYEGAIFDSVRGTGLTKSLTPSSTRAESGNTTDFNLTSFNSNGFSLASTSGANPLNRTSDAYVAWQWQAGQGTTSSNTNGSITSTVSVNATAGLSIVSYNGNATAGATIGHGLGVAPAFIIAKGRGAATSWSVYHKSLGASQYILLNTTAAAVSSTQEWGGTAPTSSVITIGNASANNNQAIANIIWAFAEIAGYSAFGKYQGNSSADGVFVYTGFRPKLVILRPYDGAADWILEDTSRSPYNVSSATLYPNSSGAEASGTNLIDFLSNGFKIRTASGNLNSSANNYLYACFAENPFRNSLAR